MNPGKHIFFTSDLHLGHTNVIRFCERPFNNCHEMDKALINNWNKAVCDSDLIYCLGDIILKTSGQYAVPIMQQLRGRKILIQGNHDKLSLHQYQEGGFTVLQEAKITLDGKLLNLSHYPYCPAVTETDSYQLRFLDERPLPGREDALICGHVHKSWKTRVHESGRLMINVGVDIWDYAPVRWAEVQGLIDVR